jgi:flagellar basal-body rod protein FlgB
MDFQNITLFDGMKKKFAWLTQRQEVIAENIANADSPNYRARDLKPFDFKRMLRRERNVVNMDATNVMHLPGRRRSGEGFGVAAERHPYETAPDGNSVVIEEQMQKMNEVGTTHKLITELYRKNMALFKMAVGR